MSNQPADGIFSIIVLGVILLCFLPQKVLFVLLAVCMIGVAALIVLTVRSFWQEKQKDASNSRKSSSYGGRFRGPV